MQPVDGGTWQSPILSCNNFRHPSCGACHLLWGGTKHADVVAESKTGERCIAGDVCADIQARPIVGGIAAQCEVVQVVVVVVEEDAT